MRRSKRSRWDRRLRNWHNRAATIITIWRCCSTTTAWMVVSSTVPRKASISTRQPPSIHMPQRRALKASSRIQLCTNKKADSLKGNRRKKNMPSQTNLRRRVEPYLAVLATVRIRSLPLSNNNNSNSSSQVDPRKRRWLSSIQKTGTYFSTNLSSPRTKTCLQ